MAHAPHPIFRFLLAAARTVFCFALALVATCAAINAQLPSLRVLGISDKLDYLRATVELALARDDLGPEFRAWLSGYVREQGIG